MSLKCRGAILVSIGSRLEKAKCAHHGLRFLLYLRRKMIMTHWSLLLMMVYFCEGTDRDRV